MSVVLTSWSGSADPFASQRDRGLENIADKFLLVPIYREFDENL